MFGLQINCLILLLYYGKRVFIAYLMRNATANTVTALLLRTVATTSSGEYHLLIAGKHRFLNNRIHPLPSGFCRVQEGDLNNVDDCRLT